MFGKNTPIKPVYESRGVLNVIKTWKTIQGEGPFSGVPAIFVRLAGCNLRCFFCDTEFSKGSHEVEVTHLIEEVWSLISDNRIQLVVLTGGEPLAQPVVPFIRALVRSGLHVQIETAGTVWQEGLEALVHEGGVTIVCSPKTATVHAQIAKYAEHFKYIIRAGETSPLGDGLPNYSTQEEGRELRLWRPPAADVGPDGVSIWVQPCDEYQLHEGGSPLAPDARDVGANNTNRDACVEIALKFGYRISVQTHKTLGVE